MHPRGSRRARVRRLGHSDQHHRTRVLAILSVPTLSLLLPAFAVWLASAGGSGQLTRTAAGIARFLLYYSGVFALVALTAAVAAGLLATDRTLMTPDRRIFAQALHRTSSLTGVSALANHIMLEVLAHRAKVLDGFIPFMAARSTLYMGLGTLASDLFVVIILTGALGADSARARATWSGADCTSRRTRRGRWPCCTDCWRAGPPRPTSLELWRLPRRRRAGPDIPVCRAHPRRQCRRPGPAAARRARYRAIPAAARPQRARVRCRRHPAAGPGGRSRGAAAGHRAGPLSAGPIRRSGTRLQARPGERPGLGLPGKPGDRPRLLAAPAARSRVPVLAWPGARR